MVLQFRLSSPLKPGAQVYSLSIFETCLCNRMHVLSKLVHLCFGYTRISLLLLPILPSVNHALMHYCSQAKGEKEKNVILSYWVSFSCTHDGAIICLWGLICAMIFCWSGKMWCHTPVLWHCCMGKTTHKPFCFVLVIWTYFATSRYFLLFLPLRSSVCVTCSVPISAAHHAPAIMAIRHANIQLEPPLGDQINVPLIFERGQEKWNACFSHLIMCRIAWGRSGKTTCLFVDQNEIRGPCMDTGR